MTSIENHLRRRQLYFYVRAVGAFVILSVMVLARLLIPTLAILTVFGWFE